MQNEWKVDIIQNQPPRPSWFKPEFFGTEWDIWTEPTIIITEDDPGWEVAYERWLDGKNPTDSPEWKKGTVVAFCRAESKPSS